MMQAVKTGMLGNTLNSLHEQGYISFLACLNGCSSACPFPSTYKTPFAIESVNVATPEIVDFKKNSGATGTS